MEPCAVSVGNGDATGSGWTIKVASLQRGLLWAFVASGASASIEPSPYEFMFLVAALALGPTAMRFHRIMIPMIVLLALYNAGGLLSLIPALDETRSITFIGISNYMALTAAFFAGIVAKEPIGRMTTIRSAYVASGVFASALALLGYFNVLGLSQFFTLYGDLRASGPFKDPNVLAPFLVPPVIFLMQDVLLARAAGSWRRLPLMLVVMLAILLTFSRGGWGVLVLSSVGLIGLTFATTGSARLRLRIVIVGAGCALLAVLALALVVSIPSIGSMFTERASLDQSYDVGELGRFGSQLRSIPMLLERPLGFGPLRFDEYFPAAPHNVYINAFSAYGWLGGVSYLAFALTTIAVGLRAVFQKSRVQSETVAVWSCLLPQILQGVQIDTDHWRHLFLLFGCLYGLAAAAAIEANGRNRTRAQSTLRAAKTS